MNLSSSIAVSPDSAAILYWSAHSRTEPQRLMRLPLPQGVPQQVLEFPAGEDVDFDCPLRANGHCVLYRWEKDEVTFYELDPLQGQGKELKRFKLGSHQGIAVSPDGMRVATFPPAPRPEKVILLDLSTGEETTVPLPASWLLWDASWAPDGKGMYLDAQTESYFIVHLALDGTFRVLLDRGRDNWLGCAVPSRDGLHLAFCQNTWDNNAWLLENF